MQAPRVIINLCLRALVKHFMKKVEDSSKENSPDHSKSKFSKRDAEEVRKIGKFTLENPLKGSLSSTAASKKDKTEVQIISSSKKDLSKGQQNINEKADKKRNSVFKTLAEPKLPELPKRNRARLHIQSPTKLYFYWSIKNDPFKTLSRTFGNKESYNLVAKLLNQTRNIESFFPVEAEGDCWFNVEADSNYRVEIGFHAPTRPFVRIMFSNEVQTPRRGPSKREDLTPHFGVSANQFARVLDVSGYKRDAFEVLIAGDDPDLTENATKRTYFELTGKSSRQLFSNRKGDELRIALLALAYGYSLEDVKPEISSTLFAELESEKEKMNAERILSALRDNFDVLKEIFFEEEVESAIRGASLVNFPKTYKRVSTSSAWQS